MDVPEDIVDSVRSIDRIQLALEMDIGIFKQIFIVLSYDMRYNIFMQNIHNLEPILGVLNINLELHPQDNHVSLRLLK